MVSKFISLSTGQAHLARSLTIGAATVLLLFQLPSGYCDNARESATPVTSGQTANDADGVNASNHGTHTGSELGGAPTSGTGPANSSPTSDNGGQVNVKSFGAVGDGVTNDTGAFIAALKSVAEAGGGTCLVPEGTYLISASGISTGGHRPSVLSGVHLIGAGRGASILKLAGMPTYHLLPCDGENWSVENLTFDMGDYTPPVGQAAIACKGNNWRVANCAIVKSGRWGIIARGGNNWTIEGNYISRTVPGARPAIGAILVTSSGPGAWPSHGRVVGNICEGGGMTITGNNTIVAHNQVNRSGSGSGIFVQGSPSTHSPTIIGNVCAGGGSGYEESGKWWSVNGFEIWAPDSVICDNTAHDNDGGGIAIGGQNSIVIGNKAYNNGRGRAGSAGFVARINPHKGTSASNSVFIRNLAYDTRYPGHNATQDYGYVEQTAGVTDVKHFANDYNRNRVGPIKTYAQQGNALRSISPEMKNNLKALAEDVDLPDSDRQAVREYLAR